MAGSFCKALRTHGEPRGHTCAEGWHLKGHERMATVRQGGRPRGRPARRRGGHSLPAPGAVGEPGSASGPPVCSADPLATDTGGSPETGPTRSPPQRRGSQAKTPDAPAASGRGWQLPDPFSGGRAGDRFKQTCSRAGGKRDFQPPGSCSLANPASSSVILTTRGSRGA